MTEYRKSLIEKLFAIDEGFGAFRFDFDGDSLKLKHPLEEAMAVIERDAELMEEKDKKIKQLEAQVPRWIPVEDTGHKPMHGKDYLCVCTLKDYPDERWLQVLRWYADENGNGYVQRPHFTDEGCFGMLVTLWSEKPELPPMPEAPKEEHE